MAHDRVKEDRSAGLPPCGYLRCISRTYAWRKGISDGVTGPKG
jgi:hypothetical protein